MTGLVILALSRILGTLQADATDLQEICNALKEASPVKIICSTTLAIVPVDTPGDLIEEVPFDSEIDVLGNNRCMLRSGKFKLYIDPAEVLATRQDIDDSYVRKSGGTPSENVSHLFNDATCFPMLTLLYPDCGEGSASNSVHSLICSREPSRELDASSGEHRLVWKAESKVFTLFLNSTTSLPARAILDQPSPTGSDTRLRTSWRWQYESMNETSQDWFSRGNRFRVDRLSSLRVLGDDATPSVGESAPDLKLQSLSGQFVDIASLRGRVLVVDFWATWCGPCKRALPLLQSLSNELSESPVTILTVNCFEQANGDRMMANIQEMVSSLELKLPVLLDLKGSAAREWQVEGLPTTFVIDADGRIVSVHVGAGPDYLKEIREDVVDALGR